MDKEKFIADIGIEQDMFKVMNTQGVVLSVVSKGGKWRYKGAKGFYGTNMKGDSEDSKEFKQEHLSDGTVSFIPKKMEKKFRSIEAKARKKIRECSIGYNNSYVPISLYSEVMEHLEGCQKEFYTMKELVVSQADNLIDDFKRKAKASTKLMDEEDAKKELENLFAKIPTKRKLEDEMSFDIRVSTFLTMENLDLLPEEIQERIKESKQTSSDDVIREGIIDILNNTFRSLSAVINSGQRNDGTPAARSVTGLKKQAERMGQKNIFGNAKVIEIKEDIERITSFKGEELVEYGERLLADVYDYAKELSIDHEIDMSICPFTERELEGLYEMYNM